MGNSGGQWGPWLAALPSHVDLPFVHWRDSQVAALGDSNAVREARAMRQLLEDSFQARSALCPPFSHVYDVSNVSLCPKRGYTGSRPP